MIVLDVGFMQALLADDVERKARLVMPLNPAALLAADFGKYAPLRSDVRSILTGWGLYMRY